MRSALIAVLTFIGASGSILAAPVTVNYEGSILEGQPGVDQGLPIYLSQTPNNVRFRFSVPDFASLTAINSITISFDVYDDNANGFEQGDAVFVLNSIGEPNALLTSFSDLSGFTSASPLSIATSVPNGDLPNALLEIQNDGVFFIRVNRNGNNREGNDFYVDNVAVTIDAQAVPEPATMGVFAGAFGIGLLYRLRRRVSV
ncbi:MAG TPA: hypothetical protein VEX68_14860 [Bryobacteraceae bacterium]|nr:hypothetical protein [Bryobacteraceae bacterium]